MQEHSIVWTLGFTPSILLSSPTAMLLRMKRAQPRFHWHRPKWDHWWFTQRKMLKLATIVSLIPRSVTGRRRRRAKNQSMRFMLCSLCKATKTQHSKYSLEVPVLYQCLWMNIQTVSRLLLLFTSHVDRFNILNWIWVTFMPNLTLPSTWACWFNSSRWSLVFSVVYSIE